MTARDATELAERAGVPTAFVERLLDLGIVAAADDGTFPDADVYKVRFVRSSDLGGLSIEAIALDLRGTLDLSWIVGALDLLDFASREPRTRTKLTSYVGFLLDFAPA